VPELSDTSLLLQAVKINEPTVRNIKTTVDMSKIFTLFHIIPLTFGLLINYPVQTFL